MAGGTGTQPTPNSVLLPGSTRVSGRVSALLGVAGPSLATHRPLLCGGPTYYSASVQMPSGCSFVFILNIAVGSSDTSSTAALRSRHLSVRCVTIVKSSARSFSMSPSGRETSNDER